MIKEIVNVRPDSRDKSVAISVPIISDKCFVNKALDRTSNIEDLLNTSENLM